MSERNYYVFGDDNCKFESMTKEQILSAIAEATGNAATNVDDAFITKIKEMNANRNLQFWIGTSAEFNALSIKEENTLYIFTDDDTEQSIEEELNEMDVRISAFMETMLSDFSETQNKVNEAYNSAQTLAQTEFTPVTYTHEITGTTVYSQLEQGLYMVRLTAYKVAVMMDVFGNNNTCSYLYVNYVNGSGGLDGLYIRATFDDMGYATLDIVDEASETAFPKTSNVISVRQIGKTYV